MDGFDGGDEPSSRKGDWGVGGGAVYARGDFSCKVAEDAAAAKGDGKQFVREGDGLGFDGIKQELEFAGEVTDGGQAKVDGASFDGVKVAERPFHDVFGSVGGTALEFGFQFEKQAGGFLGKLGEELVVVGERNVQGWVGWVGTEVESAGGGGRRNVTRFSLVEDAFELGDERCEALGFSDGGE